MFIPMVAATSTSTQDKREAILDAALELFAERGFHGTAIPLIADKANSNTDDQFIGGAKELDTCTWGYDTGPITGKDDIKHVMAYAKFVGNSAFFYMGAERIINNGDTHVDFELNRNPFKVFPGAPGVSKPDRSVGDLIVALDGIPIEDIPTLQRLLVAELIDHPAKVTVVRNERVLEIPLVAAELVT